MDPHESASEYYASAQLDLWVAESLRDKDTVKDGPMICYHLQQYAEKMIKTRLRLEDIPFRQSHDLTYLLGLLDIRDAESTKESAWLSAFAVHARYGLVKTEADSVKRAFDIVKHITTSIGNIDID